MHHTTKPSYHESLNRLGEVDLESTAAVLGVAVYGSGLLVPYYGHTYHVSPRAIEDARGRAPTGAVGELLCRYVLRSPARALKDGQRVTFRELKGAGPLVASFTGNTNKLIAGAYAHRLNDLENRARQMGAQPVKDASNFDLYVRFDALPRVPIFLQFNAADDLFPAQSALMFYQSAETYLDMQSLFILGTSLAGRLIQETEG